MLALAAATALAAAPSIDEPVRSGARSPHDAALIIGIEDYAFLPDVPHVRRDLASVADLLTYTRGVPAEHVVRLDGASVEQMRAGLQRARDALGPDGTLWVYFAGHGAADPASGDLLLVGDDAKADPTVFAARSLPVEGLLSDLPDGAVVLLDTCWAGAARSGEALLPDSRFAVPAYAATPDRPVTVWTAASPSQVSGAYAPARHGAFTYFAVGALRGWADGELSGTPDGRVDLDEATAWVTRALAATGVDAQAPTVEGPAVAALTTGELEAGPALADLPPADTVMVGVLGGIGISGSGDALGALIADVPSGTPTDALRAAGFVPPIRRVDGNRLADANDRVVPPELLYGSLQEDLEGSEALRDYHRTILPFTGGVTLATFGALAVPFAYVPYAQLRKAEKNDIGCSEPDAIDYVCIDEGKNRTVAIVMGATSAALLGSGIGMIVGSRKKARKAEEELLELVNERMER